jgi:hypothetical protein
MARSEKISIEIGAEDNASKVIDRLASRIDGLEADEARIVVNAQIGNLESALDRAKAKLDTLSGDEATVQARLIGTLESDLEQAQALFNQLDGKTGTVTLNANGNAKAELDGINDALGGLTSKLDEAIPGVGQLFSMFGKGGGAAAGIGAAAAAAGLLANNTANSAMNAAVLADLTGTTVEEASRLLVVWESTGAEGKDLQDVILQTNGALAQSPELAAQLGINMNAGLTPAQLFLETVRAINAETDPTKRALFGSQAFGEEGVRQVQTLITLYPDLAKAMRDLPPGLVITEADVRKAAEFKRDMTAVSLQVQALGADLGRVVLPLVAEVADTASDLAEILGLAAEGVRIIGDYLGKVKFPDVPGDWSILGKTIGYALNPLSALGDGFEWLDEKVNGATEATSELTEEQQAQISANRGALDSIMALADAMFKVDGAWRSGAAAAGSYRDSVAELNRLSDIDFAQQAFRTVKSFDDTKAALADLAKTGQDWKNIDLVPDSADELRGVSDEVIAVTDSIAAQRGAIQDELAYALETGGIDAYTEKAKFFRDEILAQFPQMFQDMGLSQEEATAKTTELLDELGLLPSDVEIQVKLTREQEAMRALDAFKDVIATLPPDVQVAINTAIAEGDIETALDLLNDQLINAGFDPIELQTEVDTTPGQDTVDRFIRNNQGRVIGMKVDVLGQQGVRLPNGQILTSLQPGEGTPVAEAVAVTAGQPITNVIVNIPTADPSAHMRAIQTWSRQNGRLPIQRGR